MYESAGNRPGGKRRSIFTKQLIVIDVSEAKDTLLVLVNPEILAEDGQQVGEEGCLSVPGVPTRSERAEAGDGALSGSRRQNADAGCRGLLAVCIQHEIDHLHGKGLRRSPVDAQADPDQVKAGQKQARITAWRRPAPATE